MHEPQYVHDCALVCVCACMHTCTHTHTHTHTHTIHHSSSLHIFPIALIFIMCSGDLNQNVSNCLVRLVELFGKI